ncbi:MAG: hypothetical protein Ct9H300mP19_18860 [Dehalococcoidia bacterium]|nr:MAG: hypothetical protein Ct9H300mP19_18860 [Dehalococcoidia bacterium]
MQVRTITPKKPNSALRKVARVRLVMVWKSPLTYLVKGITYKSTRWCLLGGKVPDLPGVRYHIVRGTLDTSGVEDRKRVEVNTVQRRPNL